MVLKDIHKTLESLGFKRVQLEGTHSTYGVYRGDLECKNVVFPVEIIITDKDFITPPTIRLLDHFDLIEFFQAHLNPGNSICYFNKMKRGTFVQSVHRSYINPLISGLTPDAINLVTQEFVTPRCLATSAPE